MRILRSFLALVLLVTMGLGLIVPTIAIAIPLPGIQVPTDPGDPVVTAAGDPVDGGGSGIRTMPPVPMSLPALAAWFDLAIYRGWTFAASRLQPVQIPITQGSSKVLMAQGKDLRR